MKIQVLNKKIKDKLKKLAEMTDEAKQSEEYKNFLIFCSKLHQYSFNNQWLIYMQSPNATHVAGYKAWPKKFNRHVKKNEKAIHILAPHTYGTKNNKGEEVTKVGFHSTCVFDISQTEGEPVPKAPEWKSLEKDKELTQYLKDFCKGKGIQVTTEELEGETQGLSYGGKIKLSPEAGTKTFVHEIAHELLHQGEGKKILSQIKELQAESVAFVVSTHFGLPSSGSSNYIALHNNSSDNFKASISVISGAAKEIIEYVERNRT